MQTANECIKTFDNYDKYSSSILTRAILLATTAAPNIFTNHKYIKNFINPKEVGYMHIQIGELATNRPVYEILQILKM
ncbi:MAG: hypothetical protein AB8U25_03545 [Rickettsiales endosymbiont of Dermacentor nuttalli]